MTKHAEVLGLGPHKAATWADPGCGVTCPGAALGLIEVKARDLTYLLRLRQNVLGIRGITTRFAIRMLRLPGLALGTDHTTQPMLRSRCKYLAAGISKVGIRRATSQRNLWNAGHSR